MTPIPFARPTAEQIAAETSIDVPVYFAYEHLPPHLAEVSRPFAALALHLIATMPRSASRTVILRKLVESKDEAVRAQISSDRAAARAEAAVVAAATECRVPPIGWRCSRPAGHEGPCAAEPLP